MIVVILKWDYRQLAFYIILVSLFSDFSTMGISYFYSQRKEMFLIKKGEKRRKKYSNKLLALISEYLYRGNWQRLRTKAEFMLLWTI